MKKTVKKRTLVCNLIAGPSVGKTSTMAGVFSKLKWRKIDCEQTPEFAKEKVWEESYKVLDDQIYIFAKQLHKLNRLDGKVDVVITDSPLLLSLHYGEKLGKEFKDLVRHEHDRFWNLNIYLRRKKKYNPNGRIQNKKEAKKVDKNLAKLLIENKIDFSVIDGAWESEVVIADTIEKMLRDKAKVSPKRKRSI